MPGSPSSPGTIVDPPRETAPGGGGIADDGRAAPESASASGFPLDPARFKRGDGAEREPSQSRLRRGWQWLAARLLQNDGEIPAWLVSAVVHAIVLLILAMTGFRPQARTDFNLLLATTHDISAAELPGFDRTLAEVARDEPAAYADNVDPLPIVTTPLDIDIGREDAALLTSTAILPLDAVSLARRTDAPARGGLAGRKGDLRGKLLSDGGGSGATETAVRRGLRWLAAHQRNDGSWRFDHRDGPCRGQCQNHGTHAATTGATGAALLAFLGAGETHREGEYQEVVRRGLYYLSGRVLETPQGGDLQEGTMYAHGLATIALCEAYALTQDRDLRDTAQSAVKFTEYAQDRRGGGWRYVPGEPGDTTVFGWQLMSLKAAQMAYLQVSARSFLDGERFLDSVQDDDGATYGYQKPGAGHTTTAIGLLCRMYGGWPRQRPALADGVARLAYWGPSSDDMYYNYYATQALRHYGGGLWNDWNKKLSPRLIKTQSTTGHESGSWYFDNDHLRPGGRLLCTALCVMTLEVYYRHLPLYQDVILDDMPEE